MINGIINKNKSAFICYLELFWYDSYNNSGISKIISPPFSTAVPRKNYFITSVSHDHCFSPGSLCPFHHVMWKKWSPVTVWLLSPYAHTHKGRGWNTEPMNCTQSALKSSILNPNVKPFSCVQADEEKWVGMMWFFHKHTATFHKTKGRKLDERKSPSFQYFASEEWLLKWKKAMSSDESLLNISANKSNCELAFIKENEYWHKLFKVLLKISKMIFIELRLWKNSKHNRTQNL